MGFALAVAAGCARAPARPGGIAPPTGRPADAERAMARLVDLDGEWVAVEADQEFPARFERAAAGTAVVQQPGV